MTVGMARVTVFQEISPGAGSKTGDFENEMLGGATVERLHGAALLSYSAAVGCWAISQLMMKLRAKYKTYCGNQRKAKE